MPEVGEQTAEASGEDVVCSELTLCMCWVCCCDVEVTWQTYICTYVHTYVRILLILFMYTGHHTCTFIYTKNLNT